MSTTQVPAIDMNKLNVFIGQFVSDFGAAAHAGMVVIGEKLGLYKALAGGPMSSAQLAAKTKTDERYLREWLASQAAGGYVTYDETNGKFSLSKEQAFALAAEVNRLNEERQSLTRVYELQAHELVQAQFESGEYALVCGGDDWPGGIVGLVAGKLAQAYNRPTLVYRKSDGVVTGSGRSIQGFNLLGALQACDDVFDRYGGHQAAAGFTLKAERLDELIERFQLAVRETLPPERLEPILWIDGYLKPETISYDFARSLERLAPFGAGFQYPTFAARGMRLTESRQLGAEGQHWRARFRAFESVPVEAVFFDHGQLATEFRVGEVLDTAFRLKRTRFDGYWRLEMELLDVARPLAA